MTCPVFNMKKLFCYLENCLGCKSCELACAVEHSKSKELYSAITEKPLPRQRIFVQSCTALQKTEVNAAPHAKEWGFMRGGVNQNQGGGVYRQGSYPLQCRHCEEPACMYACMSAAISKDSEKGVVSIDKNRCVGCGMCIMSCPFGALIMDKDEKITLKCDLCFEKGEPACRAACPTKSLFFGTVEEFRFHRKSGD